MLTREARFTKYQSQLFQVMFMWIIFSFIEILLTKELTPHSFLTVIPSLTYFISHYLLLIRRRWIAETMCWLFLAATLSISNLAARGKIEGIDYSALQVKTDTTNLSNKKVMVLGPHDGSVYANNSLGGFFLNWSLSQPTLEHPDEYDQVTRVYQAFQRNAPDVIIDRENRLAAFFDRIPSLRAQYRKEGSNYVRIANN
jgi:hypothetical protein